MPHGYDLYVLGVQECVGDNTLNVIEVRIPRPRPPTHSWHLIAGRHFGLTLVWQDYLQAHGVLRMSLHSGKLAVPLGSHADKSTGRLDRVLGRGDGSFISPKFTGLAVYGGATARRRYGLKVVRAAVHSFGKTAVRAMRLVFVFLFSVAHPCVTCFIVWLVVCVSLRLTLRTDTPWCCVCNPNPATRAPRVVWDVSCAWGSATWALSAAI